jgi:uncharacterized protein YndB with AHSA1/START domain
MAQASDETTGGAAPLKMSRVFHAPREKVFAAWSSAEALKRWFCPQPFTAPDARVEMWAGGVFDLCMRGPTGEEHWIRGKIVEVEPNRRLVIDMLVTDAAVAPQFRAWTEIEFADAIGGTRMDVTQSYTLVDPTKGWMVAGAPQGWRSTLDNLEAEVLRVQGGKESEERSAAFGAFQLSRTFAASRARVWRALTDESAKAKWFSGTPGEWELIERHIDVRVGGTERLKGRWQSGVVSTFDAVYHDVVVNERLIYSYAMYLNERKISVSLATLQLREAGGATTFHVTEQGAFLDGYDDAGSRERGAALLLDALDSSLRD